MAFCRCSVEQTTRPCHRDQLSVNARYARSRRHFRYCTGTVAATSNNCKIKTTISQGLSIVIRTCAKANPSSPLLASLPAFSQLKRHSAHRRCTKKLSTPLMSAIVCAGPRVRFVPPSNGYEQHRKRASLSDAPIKDLLIAGVRSSNAKARPQEVRKLPNASYRFLPSLDECLCAFATTNIVGKIGSFLRIGLG
jgi:hypothetical protein